MSEDHVLEGQGLELAERHRVRRPGLDRDRQDGLEGLERRLGLAIGVDHRAELLQRAEDEEGVDPQGEELADGDLLREDQVEHQEQDRGAQGVDRGALDEAQQAQRADLAQLELQDPAGDRR